MLKALLAITAAISGVLLASPDASACDREVSRPVVVRPTSNVLARAAELDRQARSLDAAAQEHTERAAAIRAAAEELEQAVPVSFGEVRDAVLARIDALFERASIETGAARSSRVRASELRAEAQRLRASVNGNGGGWRGNRDIRRPTAASSVDI